MTERDQDNPLRRQHLEQNPPQRLKDRVISQLAANGLITSPIQPLRFAAAFASGVLVALTAVGLNRAPSSPPPSHVLLLYDTPSIQRQSQQQLVSEYGKWAISLAERGMLAAAEQLGATGPHLGPEIEASSVLTPGGLFLVSVESTAQAVEVAQESPHVRYGGRVEIRPIVVSSQQ